MSIEQIVHEGYVNTHLRDWGGSLHCYFWMADRHGKRCETTVIMDASDCRNVASTLIDRAKELEAVAEQISKVEEGGR